MAKARQNLEFKDVKDNFAETNKTVQAVKNLTESTAKKIKQLDNEAKNPVELKKLEDSIAGVVPSLGNGCRDLDQIFQNETSLGTQNLQS